MAIIKRKDVLEVDAILSDLKSIRTEIDLLSKSMKGLHQQKRSLNDESTGSNAKKAVDLTKQLEANTQKLAAAQTDEAKALAQLKVLNQEQNKLLKQQAREVLGLTDEYEKQSKQLTKLRREAKNQTLTLQKGRKELGLTRKEYRKQRKELAALSRDVNKLDKNLKNVDSSFGQSQRFVGQYGKALKGVGTQLLGAAGIVGGVQLLVDGLQMFAQTSKEVNDLTRKIGTNFGLFGGAAKELAAQVNAIATTFEEDYNEVLQAANVVSKEFGITGAEATKLIEEGFLKGSNNSGEFLDIIKEYPTQLKSIGLTADESFAIINQQVTQGVYSDKGIDALKEAGIRLRENSKAVQESLNIFDADTKAQIENAVARGDVFEATQLISKGIKENGLTAQQTQQIISSVFGGAGEDAQSFVLALDDIQLSLDNVAIQASEAEQASLNLSTSWNRFVAGVSDSDGIFGKVFARLKNLLAGAINSLTFLIEKLSGGDKAIDRIKTAIERLKQSTEEQTQANNNLATSTVKLTAAQRKQIEAEKALNAERERRARIAQDNEQVQTITTAFQATGVTGGFDPVKSALSTTQEVNKVIENENAARRQRELEKELAFQEAKKELVDSFIEQTFAFASDIADTNTQERLSKIEAQAEAEKQILQQRLDDGLISEGAFRAKVAEIDKKARQDSAKAEKRGALFQIGIDTAAAVVKALGSTPPPFNFINAGLVGAQGAIQAALVAAKPLPSFGEGGKIEGKPHSKGGVNINAEGGEYVVKKESYANAPLTTEMINRGLITDNDLSKGMTRTQTDGLVASLLMRGLGKSDEMIMALMNISSNRDYGTYVIETKGSGQVTRYNKG